MKSMIGLSAIAVSLLSFSAIAGTVDDTPTVESPYTYTWDDKAYTCTDDPGWWFNLTDGTDVAKEAGCRPVTVLRHAANPMYDVTCWATECCKWVIRTSSSGWPIAVLVCSIDRVKCPTQNVGDPWPQPPPP
jgi:hypothetical protein